MDDNQEKQQTSLIHSGSRGVTKPSSNLVRRGLDHLSKREPRFVSFPKDWPIGMLYTVDEGIEIWEKDNWVKAGEAIGFITIPPGRKLILDVGNREHDYTTTLYYDYFFSYESNHFVDLSPLANLKPDDLQGLDFGYTLNWCQIENWDHKSFELIEHLTGVEWLNLSGAPVSDLWFLKSLTNLRGLNIDETDICSLAPLQKLTNLRYLSLGSTEIYDLEYLEDLVNLEKLYLLETPVWDLSYLKGLSKLRLLDLRATIYDEDSYEVKELKLVLPNCEIWF